MHPGSCAYQLRVWIAYRASGGWHLELERTGALGPPQPDASSRGEVACVGNSVGAFRLYLHSNRQPGFARQAIPACTARRTAAARDET